MMAEMKRHQSPRTGCRPRLSLLLAVASALALTAPVAAEGASGQVTYTGTISATMSMHILDPDMVIHVKPGLGGQPDYVLVLQGTPPQPHQACVAYVVPIAVVVASNGAWDGVIKVKATHNDFTSQVVTAGALRFTDTIPETYAEAAAAPALSATHQHAWTTGHQLGGDLFEHYILLCGGPGAPADTLPGPNRDIHVTLTYSGTQAGVLVMRDVTIKITTDKP